MQTADTSNLFQSDQQHARASFRAAKFLLHAESGDPIQLGSKPLRVVIKQGKQGREAEAWCAESGFVVRRVGLESGKTRQIYKGHFGPVTSLDFYPLPATSPATLSREVLISGSWDKSFKIWDTLSKTALSTTLAHTDFVKALIVIPSLQILVTGSSDKDIRIWDLSVLSGRDLDSLVAANKNEATPEEDEKAGESTSSSQLPEIKVPTGAAPPTPKSSHPIPFLLSLKGHTRPIERLATYPITKVVNGTEPVDSGRVALVSVDSLGALKTWELWKDEENQLKGELRSEIRPHEIGIYDIVVGDGEMWTASADNSVLLSTFDSSTPTVGPLPTLRIPHPSPVKALLPLSIALPSLNSNYLLTGASDESIRVFDLGEIDSDSAQKAHTNAWIGLPFLGKLMGLIKEIEGHAHDIVDLGLFVKEGNQVDGTGQKEVWLLSASIDGTLRRWKWPDVLKEDLNRKVLVPVEEKEEKSVMTEEEERELDEFLDIIDED